MLTVVVFGNNLIRVIEVKVGRKVLYACRSVSQLLKYFFIKMSTAVFKVSVYCDVILI